MNWQKINQLIQDKYISVQKHPTEELYIYNYTSKTQYDNLWCEETEICRGLITDKDGNILARPFRKFKNLADALNQGEQLPIEDFEVFEKLDGSLGILYWVNGIPHLATRGSFIGDQAMMGTQILREKYGHVQFDRQYTYLFEIIYPDNRIVIDYGGMRDIILLSVINTSTGEEMDSGKYATFFKVVKRYDGIQDIHMLKQLQKSNEEGFVIRFQSGKRYKVKFDEYVRLHRLVTGVNAKTIWDLLRNKEPFDELMERVPDEFYQWVRETKKGLEDRYTSIENLVLDEWKKIKDLPTRKDKALALKDFAYKGIVFQVLDQKDYASSIWKLLRPVVDKPFRREV